MQDLQIAVRAREPPSSGRGVSSTEVKFVCVCAKFEEPTLRPSRRHNIYTYISRFLVTHPTDPTLTLACDSTERRVLSD